MQTPSTCPFRATGLLTRNRFGICSRVNVVRSKVKTEIGSHSKNETCSGYISRK